MQQIAKPNKINYTDGEKNNQGIISIESFYPGYGITLGNSIRRIMLSSLVGCAVTGVKIKGVNHEFTTLPNIKEDILEIILNLKQLSLRISGEDEIKLELNVTGKKEVKASDIKKNSQVEIANKDLVIANITDVAGSLSMEITVKAGRGYEMVNQKSINEKSTDTEVIEIDAIYSPVLSVGISVDDIRVGKMTNWDKLVFDVMTDGTITAKEAFDESLKILLDQLNSLAEINFEANKNKPVKKKKSKKNEDKVEDVKEEKAKPKAKKTISKVAKTKAKPKTKVKTKAVKTKTKTKAKKTSKK